MCATALPHPVNSSAADILLTLWSILAPFSVMIPEPWGEGVTQTPCFRDEYSIVSYSSPLGQLILFLAVNFLGLLLLLVVA